MSDLMIRSVPSAQSTCPLAVAGSPYECKWKDPYSSHAQILSFLTPGKDWRVLDVGAAHGYLAAVLQDRGFRVTALEGSADLAREAAKYCEKTIVADLDGFVPDFDEPFDTIIFGDVLEHLQDPLRVLVSFSRALKPGGQVIISIPNIANVYVRLSLLLGKFDYQDRGILDRTHLRFFTRKTFRQFIHDAGMEITDLRAAPIPLSLVVPDKFQGKLFNAVHACNAWLANRLMNLFGYQFVAVARMRRAA